MWYIGVIIIEKWKENELFDDFCEIMDVEISHLL